MNSLERLIAAGNRWGKTESMRHFLESAEREGVTVHYANPSDPRPYHECLTPEFLFHAREVMRIRYVEGRISLKMSEVWIDSYMPV